MLFSICCKLRLPGVAVVGSMTEPPEFRNHFLTSMATVAFLVVSSMTSAGSKSISSLARTAEVKTNAVPLNVPSTRTLFPTRFGLAALKAVNRSLSKEGWKVVALARLSPLVPFGLQNYLFGTTKVRLQAYAAASALGILPGTIVAVFLGATGRALLGGGNALKWGLFAAGIFASVVLSWFLGHIAKKRLGIR